METKKTAKSYSPEVKERAVRMVLEHRGEHASQWTAICSIAGEDRLQRGNPAEVAASARNAPRGFRTA